MRTVLLATLFVFGLNHQSGRAELESVAGCKDSDFVVGQKSNLISINGFQYTPKCLIVGRGSSVTFSAEGFHPLAPIPQPGNPIPSTDETVTVQFQEVGVFGYFCPRHGNPKGQGMAGAVQVVEGYF
jgi:plastocyanin